MKDTWYPVVVYLATCVADLCVRRGTPNAAEEGAVHVAVYVCASRRVLRVPACGASAQAPKHRESPVGSPAHRYGRWVRQLTRLAYRSCL